MTKFVPGRGSATAKIMIIGEAPGPQENETGLCFIGPSGQLLFEMARAAGFHLDDVYLSNVRKHQPPYKIVNGKKVSDFYTMWPGEDSLAQQIAFLNEEINAINPNILVFMGANAFESCTGNKNIFLYRGSLIRYNGRKAIGTFHPARLLHSDGGNFAPYWQKSIIEFDLKRAFDESASKELELPHRVLQVCKSSLDLYRFIDESSKDSDGYVDEDIEASHCIPSCIALSFHPSRAMSVPLLPVLYGMKLTDMSIAELADCWIQIARINAESKWKKSGHNFKYDQDKIKHFGFKLDRLSFDTQLASHSICPELPQSLAFNTSIWTREPFYKEEGSEFDPKKHKIERVFLYNAKDSAVTNEVRRAQIAEIARLHLEEFFYDFVMELHPLYMDIEEVGFRVDEPARIELIRKYVKRQVEKEYELYKILGYELNVSSPKQVSITLYENLKFPRRAGTGEDILVSLMGNHAKTDKKLRTLELIIEIRKIRKTIGTYLLAKPDFDGRMRTSIFITGTETGRTSDRIMEPPIRPFPMGLAFKTMTKHGDVGADLRTMLIVDEGYVFINVDLSQAESRVVALLSDDEEKLRMMDAFDIHSVTASWVYGGDNDAWTKARHGGNEPSERFIGKTLRHAGERGMGKHRLMDIVNTDSKKYGIDLTISEWKAGLILDIFHRKDTSIKGDENGKWIGIDMIERLSYFKLIETILKENKRVIEAPYGRRRVFFERWGEDLFKEAYSHLPQAIVSDKIKMVALAMRRRVPGIRIVLEGHDALLFSLRINEVDRTVPLIREEMSIPIPFTGSIPRRSLTIPCDVEIGERNYKDLKKYRRLEVA